MGMSESQPELPEIPEAPEAAKWAAFIHHHLNANREVFMKPPVWAAILIAGGLAYYFGSHNQQELLAVKEERNSFLTDQLNAYKERLRGATPDQAAQQISLLENNLKKANDKITVLAQRVQEDEANSKAITTRLGALEPIVLSGLQLTSLEQSVEALSPLHVVIDVDTACSECQKLEGQLFRSLSKQKSITVQMGIMVGPSVLARSGIGLFFSQTLAPTKQDKILRAFRDANIPFDRLGTGSQAGSDLVIQLNTRS
jgi:hypothetical protein